MLGNYQIALIVLLVLNFIFWILIICWRIFLNKSSFRQPPAQRNRLPRMVYDNPTVSITDETDTSHELPSYTHVVGDLNSAELPPPSYEEVAKSIDPAPPYSRVASIHPTAVSAPLGETARSLQRRISEDDQLTFYDEKGNSIDVYTIPIEPPCYLVLDNERALRLNQADA